jgi:hypothetical protein
MKIAELLRNLADVIDQEIQSDRQSSAEVSDHEGDLAPQRFVPPLQLKLELLKRAVDVNNIYSPNVPDQDGRVPPHHLSLSRGDNDAETEQDYSTTQTHGEDDMNQLRRRIASLLQVDAGGDGPLDD